MSVFVADERDADEDESVDLARLRDLATFVAAAERVPEGMDLSVLCVSTPAIAELNAEHMGAQGPTDVLAFPIDLPGESLGDGPAILGDVVLSPAVAAGQARRAGHDLAAELDLLVVHGILHLLGHDHAEEDERQRMLGRTAELLEGWQRERNAQGSGEPR
ncbi:MAG: rRNA maturation RNase YbeY [Egibacteraceae bacterium]